MGHLKNFEPQRRQLSPGKAQSLLKEEPVENLIKDIAMLELEVIYLEKYLLSMYRRSFAKRLSTLPTADERPRTNAETHNQTSSSEVAKSNLESVNENSVIRCSTVVPHDDSAIMFSTKCNDIMGAETLIDTGIDRSQSSLSHRSACSFRTSPPFEAVAEAVDAYHSLPLSMLEAFLVYGIPRGNLKRISLALKVRSYTPKKVFQELEMAKEEYIQMNIKLHKEQRLLIPKNVEYFIKETGLSPSGVAEMLEQSMPDSMKNNFHQPQQGKFWKKLEWIPHNFTFRFLLSNELVS
ncbi:UNVERIFIED_CONTAM: hypothetical protein Sindi_0265700 [Sesamum indicum]